MSSSKTGLLYFTVVFLYIASSVATPVDLDRTDAIDDVVDVTRHTFLNGATTLTKALDRLDADKMLNKRREEEIQNLDSSIWIDR